MANKFSQIIQGPTYKARSLQESLIAPMALREQHDNAIAAAEENYKTALSAEVDDLYKDDLKAYQDKLGNDIESLISNINTSGINSNSNVEKFGAMKRQITKDFSNSGSIGIAMNARKMINERNAGAMELALKQGQSPEVAQNWAKKDIEEYYKNAPKGLMDLKTALPDYNPTLAPKVETDLTLLNQLTPHIGSIKTRIYDILGDNSNYDIVKEDGRTFIVGTNSTTNKYVKEDISNEQNLVSAFDYIKQVTNDKDSPLAKHLKYNGIDMKTIVDRLDDLQKMSLNKGTSTDINIYSQEGGAGQGYKNNGYKNKPKEDAINTRLINSQFTSGMSSMTSKEVVDKYNKLLHKQLNEPQNFTDKDVEDLNNYKIEVALLKDRAKEIQVDLFNTDGTVKKEYESIYYDYTNEKGKVFNLLAGKLRNIDGFLLDQSKSDIKVVNEELVNYREGIRKGIKSNGATLYNNLYSKVRNKEYIKKYESQIKGLSFDKNDLKEKVAMHKVLNSDFSINNKSQTFLYSDLGSKGDGNSDLKNYSETLINTALNGVGGTLKLIDEDGKLTDMDLSTDTSKESVRKLIGEGTSTNFKGFNISNKGVELLVSSSYTKEGKNISSTFVLPVKPVLKNGVMTLEETTEDLFNYLASNTNNPDDLKRLNYAKNNILLSNNGINLDVNKNGKARYNTSVNTSKIVNAAITYNIAGYKGTNQQSMNYNYKQLNPNNYPYTDKNLETASMKVVNVNGENMYTTNFTFKGDKSPRAYTMSDYLVTNSTRNANGAIRNRADELYNTQNTMSEIIQLIGNGEIKGVSADDNTALQGVMFALTNQEGALQTLENEFNFKKELNRRTNNGKVVKGMTPNFLTNAEEMEYQNKLASVFKDISEKMKYIAIAARSKNILF